MNVHTKPDSATSEILSLEQVLIYADEQFSDDDDVILLGDFNADGKYFSESENVGGIRGPDYVWVIGDDQDTNLASAALAYDRIVFRSAPTSEDYTGDFDILRFDKVYKLAPDKAKGVSDHYPVSARFFTDRDTD